MNQGRYLPNITHAVYIVVLAQYADSFLRLFLQTVPFIMSYLPAINDAESGQSPRISQPMKLTSILVDLAK
jgi:hypothetical protein